MQDKTSKFFMLPSSSLTIGDWVVVMNGELINSQVDISTYEGMPCKVLGFMEDGRVKLQSPCKVHWGKTPLDIAPLEQLIKISKEDGERFAKQSLLKS